MAKGDMFLKLHAAYHSQAEPKLNTSRVKPTELVKLLSRHYHNIHQRCSEKGRKRKREQSPLKDPLDLQSAENDSDHSSEGPRMKISKYEATESPRNHPAPKRIRPSPKSPLIATDKKTKAQEIFGPMMQVVDDEI